MVRGAPGCDDRSGSEGRVFPEFFGIKSLPVVLGRGLSARLNTF